MDIMINNVVLLFSATNEEIPYEQLLQYWIVNQQETQRRVTGTKLV